MRLINTHDQLVAAGGGIAIAPAYGGIRNSYVDGWHVIRVDAQGKHIATDPDAAWHHHGQKWFSNTGTGAIGFHKAQAAALEEAKRWVAKTYGEQGPWKRNRARSYVPARIQDAFPIPRRDDP